MIYAVYSYADPASEQDEPSFGEHGQFENRAEAENIARRMSTHLTDRTVDVEENEGTFSILATFAKGVRVA